MGTPNKNLELIHRTLGHSGGCHRGRQRTLEKG